MSSRQKIEVRDQRSEIRGQRSEIRDQRSEIRGQRSEIRDQRSEVRDQRTEDRGRGDTATRGDGDAEKRQGIIGCVFMTLCCMKIQ